MIACPIYAIWLHGCFVLLSILLSSILYPSVARSFSGKCCVVVFTVWVLWITFFVLKKQAVAQDARKAPILVTGNNLEVTEPIKEYVEKKMANVLDKVLLG